MTRVFIVRFVNDNMATISGHASRELLTEMRGRPPIWSTLSRGWVTTPRTARDAVAIAESRRYEIVVETGDPMPEARGLLW